MNLLEIVERDARVYERFLSKIRIDSRGCWLFESGFDEKGYTTISIHCKKRRTHRYSYETHAGRKIPPGLTIDHLCGVRNCVNPAHLEVVSLRENILRGGSISALQKRRESLSLEERKAFMREVQRRGAEARRAATHCKRGHAYTPDNVVSYGRTKRACRICTRETMQKAWRRYRAKQKAVRELANL